jgi:hypothetical protein
VKQLLIAVILFSLIMNSLLVGQTFAHEEVSLDENVSVEIDFEQTEIDEIAVTSDEIEVSSVVLESVVMNDVSINDFDEETSDIEVVISAVNPGYTSGSQNVNDMIELYNVTGKSLSLDGYSLVYNGKELYSFTKGDVFLEDESFILLRANNSRSEGILADDWYAGNLAIKGTPVSNNMILELTKDGVVVDTVCWSGEGCYSHFDLVSTREKTLVRCMSNANIEKCGDGADFEYIADYAVSFGGLFSDTEGEVDDEDDVNLCEGLRLNEIGANLDEQFIEIYNSNSTALNMTGCRLRMKSGNSYYTHVFDGRIGAYGYLAIGVASNGLKLTKSPTSAMGNEVQILSSSDDYEPVDKVSYKKQKSGTSLAWFAGGWKSTYIVTPGADNKYSEFRICEAGKVINPATGNCINNKEDEPLPDCGPGKFRNPETNRCKSYAQLTSVLAPCKEGYYRNPETNRCKKIETTKLVAACAVGYERNPETGRCRKIRENEGAGYGLSVVDIDDKSSFIGMWSLAGVTGAGMVVVGFQFRDEICGLVKKVFEKITTKH